MSIHSYTQYYICMDCYNHELSARLALGHYIHMDVTIRGVLLFSVYGIVH